MWLNLYMWTLWVADDDDDDVDENNNNYIHMIDKNVCPKSK